MIHIPPLCKWGNDNSWNSASRSKAITPSRSRRWGHVVPEPSILIIGHYDEDFRPLWAFAQVLQNFRDVKIATDDIRERRMLGQPADWLVKRDLRKRARVNVAHEILAIVEKLRAIRCAG